MLAPLSPFTQRARQVVESFGTEVKKTPASADIACVGGAKWDIYPMEWGKVGITS
jgi:hypothetical protein